MATFQVSLELHGSETHSETEDDMEQAELATQILSNLGILLVGIGVVWWVSMQAGKKKE